MFNDLTPNIRKGVLVIILLVLIAIGYSVVRYAETYSQSIQPGSFRSFSATGEGKVISVPDVAEFSYSVINQGGKDLAALQEQNSVKTQKINDFLKSKSVADKDIKTENYSVEPRYQYYGCPRDGGACPPADIVGYTITQSVSIKVRDFKQVSEILAGVVVAGANNVSQLSFKIDDPSKVRNEARALAIIKAREQANSIAKAGGFRLGQLLSIEEAYNNQPMPYYGLEMGGDMIKASMAPVTPAIEPGSQEVVVNIVLRYEIK
ncbi:MAG: SIMPL domain-containing protein [Candidatus Vogelbacteria bacterium]|nr:SIMPL domain-containing protein [Candidatus Vogelbacteria bacterium]